MAVGSRGWRTILRLLPGIIPPPPKRWRGRAGGPFSLLCLAPRGVCRAPSVTLGAVSSYLAFSPLLPLSRSLEEAVYFLRHFPSAGAFAVGLPHFHAAALPCGVRTFLPPPVRVTSGRLFSQDLPVQLFSVL